MPKKIFNHLLIALVFFSLTLCQQYLFYYIKDFPIIWLTPGKYFGIFTFLLAATFIKSFFLRYFFLGLVLLLNYFQMSHLSYFGTQILPSGILLLFTQIHEITGTVFVEHDHILIPLIFTLIPASLGWLLLKKRKNLYGFIALDIIFCLYFMYNPIRTYVTGNTWGRQPSTRELSGMNVYLSFSYFLGKILPAKIMSGSLKKTQNSSTDLKLTDGHSSWDKIILVMGESLSPHQMSLYDYERSTTPYLKSLKNDPHFFHTVGLSGGVSTDISIAFFFNMGFGDAGLIKASKGEHCLLKLAKQKSYSTHFFSIQSSEQLRYISPYLCSSYLDNYKTLEEIAPETKDHQAARDRDLLRELNKIIHLDSNQFIVLHQRGSHAPWQLRSTPESKMFLSDDKVSHYDNSVFEFDLFMRELNQTLKQSKKKILLLYVSDHGEALGQDGKWGHGQLIRHSFEVPVIVQSFNRELPSTTKQLPKYVSHYNLTLYLAQEIGFSLNQDALRHPSDYTIFGNDIDGFAGKANILFHQNDTYDFKVVN